MKLLESIYFSISVAILMIGIHQMITYDSLTDNYWIFMFSLGFFFLFVKERKKNNESIKK